jgi:hypothetical protein
VWFEAGACWERTSRLLTCTVGKIHKGTLTLPFGIYIALSRAIPEDLQSLFEIIATGMGPLTHSPDYEQLTIRFKDIESSIVADQEALEDPLVEERWTIVQKSIGPLEEPQRHALKLLLLYGSATDSSMLNALQSQGLGANWASVLPGLQLTTNLIQKVSGQSAVHPKSGVTNR